MKWNEFGRVCTVCNTFKPWDNFSWKRSKKYKNSPTINQVKQPKCKECAILETSSWRGAQSEGRLKDLYYKRAYGITLADFNTMFISQNGKCKLCSRELSLVNNTPDRAVVDHCHSSGNIRGILCNECNRGLGYFRDNPEALANASLYIKGEL